MPAGISSLILTRGGYSPGPGFNYSVPPDAPESRKEDPPLFSQLVFQCVILSLFIKEIKHCKNQLMELCGTAEQDQCQCDHQN